MRESARVRGRVRESEREGEISLSNVHCPFDKTRRLMDQDSTRDADQGLQINLGVHRHTECWQNDAKQRDQTRHAIRVEEV